MSHKEARPQSVVSEASPVIPAGSVREQVLGFFGPAAAGNDTRTALATHLQDFVSAQSLGDQLDAWLRLIHWTRVGTSGSLQVLAARMRWREAYLYWELLLDVLEQVPAVREAVQEAIGRIIQDTDAVNLFADAGLPCDRGFLAEFGDRLMSKLLPTVRNDRDLTHLLQRQYRSLVEVKWFSQFPSRLFARILQALTPSGNPQATGALRRAFADGFRMLAIRVEAQGLSEKLRARSRRPSSIRESPFYRLAALSDQLAERWEAGWELGACADAWSEVVIDCRNEMRWIRRQLEVSGVSVDIVYGLEVIEHGLRRMQAMASVMTAAEGVDRARAVHAFLTLLIEASHQECSLSHLIETNTRMLHRKIVDRSGATGEHYIARDRKEYRHIWVAAAGGGVLTAFTAAIKMFIFGLGLAPFLAGFGYGLNYAVSFVLMQTFGLMLATKQPAMTAATLATILREHPGSARLDEIVEFIAKISRSQIAAAVSNVLVVSLAAYALDAGWRLVTGHPILDLYDAEHVYETLSPLDSGTVMFAALTGVILWLSSLAGGWIENWTVYHRLPEAIAEHGWGTRVFGAARLRRWADSLSRNVAGWGTNVSLGMMLGMTPAIGLFFGIPLDVRHVTLSSGTLALASASLDADWYREGWFLRATAGVSVMFVLNLGVSFCLSLVTALRAYGFPRSDMLELLRRLARRFMRSPRDFFLPPREDTPPAGVPAVERDH
jgi:site-specific recombinase